MTWQLLIQWSEGIKMGSDAGKAVVGALSPVGGVLLGARDARKANKRAGREAQAHEQQIGEDRRKTAEAQSALTKKVEQQQHKLAVGQARSNRSRLRGGVFGESEPTTRNLNPNLG